MKRNRWGWAYTDEHWPPDQRDEKIRQAIFGVLLWMSVVAPILFTLWLINR